MWSGLHFWGGSREAPPPVTAENITHRVRLTRHDHHNLELKAFVDPGTTGFQAWTEVYLFVPGSFQLSRWEKKELRNDLHCRTRLAVSICTDQGHAAVREAMRRLRSSVQALGDAPEEDDSFETLVEDSKDAGAVLHETLRRWTSTHRKQLRLAHSLMHRECDAVTHLVRSSHEIRRTAESIHQVRTDIGELGVGRFPVLSLLREYTGNLYLEYLSELESELGKVPAERFTGIEYRSAAENLSDVLKNLRQAEATMLARTGFGAGAGATEEARENYLVRLSQLKKFFQSKMFIDISRRPADKRIAETTAFVGTALAGLSAASLQLLYRPTSDEVAFSGFLLGFGVVVYTLRDRIKDWLKATLAKKASSWVADMEQTLWIDGRKIGINKEWFRVSRKQSLDAEVLRLRDRACHTEVEKVLPEEVFSWKRWQMVPEPLHQRGSGLALQENLRINLDRYLKFMDDPFKELAVLDAQGQFTRFRSRRVYHFYLAVRSSFESCVSKKITRGSTKWPAPQKEKIYRVVLNKKGIDRIESIDDFNSPKEPRWYHSPHAHPCPPLSS